MAKPRCDRSSLLVGRTGRSSVERVRRSVIVAVLAAAIVLSLPPSPALADDVPPTNFDSTVTRVEPRLEGVRFVVLGGDAYLSVMVDLGHEVRVPGYFNEPYVRIDADRSVYVNERSPAYSINADRYGEVPSSSVVETDAEPLWTLVSRDGSYAWHDHRTHWMSEDLPPTVSGTEEVLVFPWSIPVLVDGRGVTVSGELDWIPSRSPVPSIMAGVIVLLALLLWRRDRLWLSASIVIAAGVASAGLTVAQASATPLVGRSFPTTVVLPLLAVGMGGFILAWGARYPRLSSVLVTTSGLLLLAWTVLSLDSLSLPVLTSGLPPVAERALIAAIGWSAVAVIGLGFIQIVDSMGFTNGRNIADSDVDRNSLDRVS